MLYKTETHVPNRKIVVGNPSKIKGNVSEKNDKLENKRNTIVSGITKRM